jgi:hypothetical protein
VRGLCSCRIAREIFARLFWGPFSWLTCATLSPNADAAAV